MAGKFPPPGCELKDSSIALHNIDGRLIEFVKKLGLIQLHALGEPLIIMTGYSESLCGCQWHKVGRAIDVLMIDKPPDYAAVMLLTAKTLAKQHGINVIEIQWACRCALLHMEII
jgi:hypothetical protein